MGRDQGGVWADERDIESFLRGAADPGLETIVIAHELGHAILDDERGDDADRVGDEIEGIETRARERKAIAPKVRTTRSSG